MQVQRSSDQEPYSAATQTSRATEGGRQYRQTNRTAQTQIQSKEEEKKPTQHSAACWQAWGPRSCRRDSRASHLFCARCTRLRACVTAYQQSTVQPAKGSQKRFRSSESKASATSDKGKKIDEKGFQDPETSPAFALGIQYGKPNQQN